MRSQSRLLDGRGTEPAIAPIDRTFCDLPELLQAGDLLVFNDTQVIKARLLGEKATGGKLELLVERVLDPLHQPHEVIAHLRVSKKPAIGAVVHLAGGVRATLLGRAGTNNELFHFRFSSDPYTVMAQHGHVPLPPYIHHTDDAVDAARYQTVFAKHPGAVAAPTAALHFDAGVLQALQQRGVQTASITLHVGAGTFQPVKAAQIKDHVMHHERYAITDEALQAIAACKARGSRLVAVGTTTIRALETYAQRRAAGESLPGARTGDTNIFITPGFDFQMADLLITNFHLPKSTLMMLVSAFAGHAHIMRLYAHAIAQRYRFFSYGDAMLLQRSQPPQRQSLPC